MNFLVDAQLPRRLARILTGAGHDAVHTLDLPNANRTPRSPCAWSWFQDCVTLRLPLNQC